MASSKARARNSSARSGRPASGRAAARTASAQKTRGQAQPKQPAARQAAAGQGQAAQRQAGQAAAGQAQAGQGQRQAGQGQATATAPEEPRAAAPKAQSRPQADRAKRQPAVPAAAAGRADPAGPAVAGGPPLWLQLVTFGLAILGLADSIYETWAHFNGSHLFACNGGGSENCTAVITSSQSMVFGVIPVAILGLLFYAFAVPIMSPWGWRMRQRWVGQLRLASMVAGMGFVMYLIYAELYQIGNWCLYCTFVHIITFLLFCVTVVAAAIWGLGKAAKTS